MAPKKNASKPKPSAKTVKAKAAVKAKPKAQGAQQARATRDVALKVKRCLKEKFSDFSPRQIYGIYIQNKNLFETLTKTYETMDRIQDGRILVLRSLFQTSSLKDCLVPLQKGLAVSEHVHQAIAYSMMTCMAERDRTKLYAVMAMAKSLNEKEVCSIWRSIISLNYFSPSNRMHIKEVLKLSLFRDCHLSCDVQFGHMKGFFLDVMRHDLSEYLAVSTKVPAQWWNDHKQFLGWHVDTATVDQVFKEGSASEKYSKIQRLAKESPLVQMLFQSELASHATQSFVCVISKKADELLSATPFTDDSYNTAKDFMYLKAEEFLANGNQASIKLDFTCKYRGIELQEDVRDPMRFIDLSLSNVVRNHVFAREQGAEMLGPEKMILPTEMKAAPSLKIDYYRDIQAGRHYFNRELQASGKVESLDIYAWAKSKESEFISRDRNFCLDMLLLYKLCNGMGVEQQQKVILAGLPDEKVVKTFAAVARAFEDIKKSTLWEFLAESQTGPLETAMQNVGLAQRGALDENTFKALSGFSAKVGERLQWFCTHLVWEGTGAQLKSTRLCGMKALQAKFEKVRTAAKEEDVSDTVAEIIQFKFLLKPEELEEFEKMGRSCSPVASVAAVAKPSKKAKVEKKSNFELAMEAASNLFSDD